MVNIYLFIELCVRSAPTRRSHQELSLANCKFANVVVLSEKLVAQLDCSTPEDGTKVVLEELPKVEGVVQTNVIAVVKPVQAATNPGRAGPSRLHAARNARSSRSSPHARRHAR